MKSFHLIKLVEFVPSPASLQCPYHFPYKLSLIFYKFSCWLKMRWNANKSDLSHCHSISIGFRRHKFSWMNLYEFPIPPQRIEAGCNPQRQDEQRCNEFFSPCFFSLSTGWIGLRRYTGTDRFLFSMQIHPLLAFFRGGENFCVDYR